ncbi:MAG TPA: M20/M25/M40 family metallo-hydrolase [Blastocatellia bacterium]|nr:M20/M25/M40 family metallo-hydrolase [Blastocatellia bacterium]
MKAKTVLDQRVYVTPKNRWPLEALAVFLSLAFVTCASLYLYNPPQPAVGGAPPGEFSSASAMAHLREIARSPRPMGSIRHAEVRDYILKELTSLGLAPEVQKATSINTRMGSPYPAATVHNIIVRLPGRASTRAVIIAGHYDSVPTGPGANDDGSAVASMLETARALKAAPPLLNDVVLLFTDGEEPGLLGATAFVDDPARVKDIGLVVNLEARGNSGPSVMFETSDQNGWLIDQYAGAAVHPVASSLTYDIYKLLPSDTDFTVFRRAGLPGLNFAYIGGSIHYHTWADSLSTVGEATLQHQGANALAMARHFGELNLEDRRERDAVYFSLLGLHTFHYPGQAIIPLTLATVLAFGGLLFSGIKKKSLSFGGVLLGFLLWSLVAAAASLIAVATWSLIVTLHTQYMASPFGDTYNSKFYMLALVALTIALCSGLYVFLSRKVSMLNLSMGGLLCWLFLTVATAIYLPGVSYLFTWPLLFGLVGLGLLIFAKDPDRISGSRVVWLVLCAIPPVLLLVPDFYQILVALTISSPAAVMALVASLLALLTPLLSLILRPYKWVLPSAALAASAALLVAGGLTSGSSDGSPQPDHVFYAANADTGISTWASTDARPDEWTSQFFSGDLQRGPVADCAPLVRGNFLKANAPPIPAPAPRLDVLEKKSEGDLWTYRTRIISPRKAEVIMVSVEGASEIVSASVNGKQVSPARAAPQGGPDSQWSIIYYAPDEKGIELDFQVRASRPPRLVVMDRSYGLPDTGGNPVKPRPGYLMPAPFTFSDSTLVTKSFSLQ